MLTRSGAPLRLAASCSRRRPSHVRSKVPFRPRAASCSSFGSVDRDADVLEKPGRGELGERLGARSSVMMVPLVVR